MRMQIFPNGITLWLSARDTQDWATKPGAAWPCSELAGKRLCASFDLNGLVELTIDGKSGEVPCDEFNAITSDFLAQKLPRDHPCWDVCVGQFLNS
jgi:hypothetical protein